MGNAAAPSQLAELGATPGSGASPNQLLHELHTTPQQTSNPHSPSITLTALGPSNQPVPANAAHTQILDEPGYGNSFHFKNTTSQYIELVELEVGLAPASVAHGHDTGPGGPKAILEIETAAHFPAEEYASGHAHQVASHGPHELLL